MTEGKTYRCGLIGTPLSHSLSPKIHTHFAGQFDMDFSYTLMDTPSDDVEKTIQSFFADGGKGLNVTMPHKSLAYELSKHHGEISKSTATVNTLWMNENSELCGDNTDATGFIQYLQHTQEFDLKGKTVLVIGAGGAAQAIIPALLGHNISTLGMLNRTPEKARNLIDGYADKRASVLEAGPGSDTFDLIINATSASIYGVLPDVTPSMIGERTFCVDLAYSKTSTVFCDWAIENGAARAWDGLGMLIEQAADAFAIWFKQRPDTSELYTQRSKLLV